MTIYKDINELKNCILELEGVFPYEEYVKLLSHIDNAKLYNISDAVKQQSCNIEISRLLVKNGIVKSYNTTKWLEEQRDKYRELLAYVEQEAKWKKSIE